MSWPKIVERLTRGESVTIRPKGQSMTPRITSGQEVTIDAVRPDEVVPGEVVLAKVHGRFYLHLVTARDGHRVQISNNHGHVNGWTTIDRVYGIVDV